MQIALYGPDIPQNADNVIRTAACMLVPVHIIEPAGFDASDRALKRAGLDYLERANLMRYTSFDCFETWRTGAGARLIVLMTKAPARYTDFSFAADDLLILGRESAGAPECVHASADARLIIAIVDNLRTIVNKKSGAATGTQKYRGGLCHGTWQGPEAN